ncbi:hypothetical protein LJC32_04190 [Oscillospiraceae bacterium OttesenSCG-928-F05]|nr:hypothetical protein [Oscillospiraceae bacterium OttesenSCG-928-F05]
MIQNGASTGVSLPITAPGAAALSMIIPNTPGTVIQFKLLDGTLTLTPPDGINALATLTGYNIP